MVMLFREFHIILTTENHFNIHCIQVVWILKIPTNGPCSATWYICYSCSVVLWNWDVSFFYHFHMMWILSKIMKSLYSILKLLHILIKGLNRSEKYFIHWKAHSLRVKGWTMVLSTNPEIDQIKIPENKPTVTVQHKILCPVFSLQLIFPQLREKIYKYQNWKCNAKKRKGVISHFSLLCFWISKSLRNCFGTTFIISGGECTIVVEMNAKGAASSGVATAASDSSTTTKKNSKKPKCQFRNPYVLYCLTKFCEYKNCFFFILSGFQILGSPNKNFLLVNPFSHQDWYVLHFIPKSFNLLF